FLTRRNQFIRGVIPASHHLRQKILVPVAMEDKHPLSGLDAGGRRLPQKDLGLATLRAANQQSTLDVLDRLHGVFAGGHGLIADEEGERNAHSQQVGGLSVNGHGYEHHQANKQRQKFESYPLHTSLLYTFRHLG